MEPASESRYYCALNQLKFVNQKDIGKSMSFSMCKLYQSNFKNTTLFYWRVK